MRSSLPEINTQNSSLKDEDVKVREEMLAFAREHLEPFEVRKKQSGATEIIPQFCPFCKGGDNGDEKSFALSMDHGVYVCKRGSCGQRGTFSYLAEHFRFATSAKPARQKRKKPAFNLPEVELLPVTEEIYEYFESRKIGRETVDAFRISSDAHGNIVFPFYMDGENTFVKFRKPRKQKPDEKGPKEWREPNTKAILFGMDDCSFSKPLIITEGQIDAMALYEAGIRNVVSVPSGCEDTSWIENCWDWLERFKKIILFGDSDDPGQKMVAQVARRLDESRCLIVEDYPEKPNGTLCKDANEVLFFHGEFALIAMIENAREIPVKGLINLGSVIPVALDSIPNIRTKIPKLDWAIRGLREGSVTIWTGKAGHGKSTLSGLFALQAVEQGKTACVYSGELSKEEYQEWINLQCAGSEYIGLKADKDGNPIPCVPYQTQQRLIQYYDKKIFLFDNEEIFEDETEDKAILRLFKVAARQHGCKLFIVDNLMMALAESDEEFRDQKKFVNSLKKFARKYGVHVAVVAHPRKTKAGEHLGGEDVGGSSAVNNLADATMVMERPNIRIVKNRVTGWLGVIECAYCPDSRRIYQADAGDFNFFSWNKEGINPPPQRADTLAEFQVQYPISDPF